MSIYYTAIETLSVKNTETCPSIVSNMHYQLSLLGMLMLWDNVFSCDLSLEADGKQYTFSGTTPGNEYKSLLMALGEAKQIELRAAYEYLWRASYVDAGIDPIQTAELAGKLMKGEFDDEWENAAAEKEFFYTFYTNADCAHGAGSLSAYGTKDGKTYCGNIEPQCADINAVDGKWFTNETVLWAEVSETPAILGIVRELEAVGAQTDLYTGTDGITGLYINSLQVDGKDAFQKLIDLLKQLQEQPGVRVEYIGSDNDDCLFDFVDGSGTYPRMLKVHENADGTMFCKLIEV